MVVDDNALVVERIAALLAEAHLQVCDRVESGLLAFARVAVSRPDVVLMDLEMPGIGGIEAIRRIKALAAPPAVIAVTLHDDPRSRADAAAAGADAFVAKSRITVELLPAIARIFPDRAAPPGATAFA
jgi:DNA-binding NarL/FixJ family response regulator